MKRYLLYVTLPYAYSILRPLEHEIRRRGGEAAWFVEEGCPVVLEEGEVRLGTIREAVAYNPVAVFAPGNYIPDFIPGVKVALFHGYAIQKRIEAVDDHFTVRGWFDIYCTQGPSSTPYFKELEKKYGFFRVYETGWPKADTYFSPEVQRKPQNDHPVILYPPTFTRNVCSAPHLMAEIDRLAKTHPWDWVITFHPKLTDPGIIAGYKRIAEENENVIFYEGSDKMPLLQQADVMLCDSSSIILEFMFLDKPVVTFRNSHPGPHLIDVDTPEAVGPAIERALARPEGLMEEIRSYTVELIDEIKTEEGTFRHDNLTNKKCPNCGKRLLAVNGKNAKLLVCQDRECGYRETGSRTTNARCPVCHKRMEMIGKGEDATFVCACGHKERMTKFQERRKKEGGGVTKRDVAAYMKKQKKEAEEPVNNAFAAALKGIKL